MSLLRRFALFAAASTLLGATPAFADTQLDFILNWVPGGDHAPYYYAKKMGWYKEAGIDLNLEPGKGSAVAVQKVGAGADPDRPGRHAQRPGPCAARAPIRWACSTCTPIRRKACTG